MSDVPPPPPPMDYNPAPTPSPDAASRVKGPAIFLIVTAAVGMAWQLLNLILNLIGAGLGAANGKEGIGAMAQGGFGVVINILALIMGIIVLMGAMKMMKLKSHGFAMAASIIAMVPCISPCCLLGIPAGIWALVVISKPEVKSAFTQ